MKKISVWFYMPLTAMLSIPLMGQTFAQQPKPIASTKSQPTKPTDVVGYTHIQMQRSSRYWTPNRLRKALPFPLPKINAPKSAFRRPTQRTNPTITIAPVEPNHHIEHRRMTSFTTIRVPTSKFTSLPYSAIGKMFFTVGGKDYVCSGATIANKAFLTAGHCVIKGGSGNQWATNIIFCPTYDSGCKRGSWHATQSWSLRGWTSDRNFAYDLAMVAVDKPLQPKTGSLGFQAKTPYNSGPWVSVGYPAKVISGYNFNGAYMWQSTGSYITGTTEIAMASNMTPGCSGGPWLGPKLSNGKRVYVSGVNSFRYKNTPHRMYSPHFGQGFLNLYKVVKNASKPLKKLVAICGVRNPTNYQILKERRDMVQFRKINKTYRAKKIRGVVTIPIFFHIIRSGSLGKVTNEQIKAQIVFLNNAFRKHGFAFKQAGIKRYNKPKWFSLKRLSFAERQMKTKLHKDTSTFLNFYTADLKGKRGTLLGWASYPTFRSGDPVMDGVVVQYQTLPNGSLKRFNLGATGAHEVGHWLGLYHTFQNGCESPGDEVADTSYQRESTSGCPNLAPISCPSDGKRDPIHNFMDYSDDRCMTLFTTGQGERMRLMTATYRFALIQQSDKKAGRKTQLKRLTIDSSTKK